MLHERQKNEKELLICNKEAEWLPTQVVDAFKSEAHSAKLFGPYLLTFPYP